MGTLSPAKNKNFRISNIRLELGTRTQLGALKGLHPVLPRLLQKNENRIFEDCESANCLICSQTVPKVTKHVFVKFLIPERLLNSNYPLRYSIFPKILLITAADQMPQVTRFRLKIIKNRIEMIETKGEK